MLSRCKRAAVVSFFSSKLCARFNFARAFSSSEGPQANKNIPARNMIVKTDFLILFKFSDKIIKFCKSRLIPIVNLQNGVDYFVNTIRIISIYNTY